MVQTVTTTTQTRLVQWTKTVAMQINDLINIINNHNINSNLNNSSSKDLIHIPVNNLIIFFLKI